ncbi:MAG: ATP-dependent zinc metalloprotease FtsH [Sedimentisphaerales bacterium]|nr:ATP-dependent zinc metalloprotease FtsH [Sedimentisphaerales bacterium]
MADNQRKKQTPPPLKKQTPQQKQQLKAYKRGPANWLLIFILIMAAIMLIKSIPKNEITWSQFEEYMKNDRIKSLKVAETEIKGTFRAEFVDSQEKMPESFTVKFNQEVFGDSLNELRKDREIEIECKNPELWLPLFINLIFPLIIFGALIYFLFLRNMRSGTGGMLMSFGRSRHRLQSKDKVTVTFKDVAGIEEAKEEVAEIIEFLKNPKKFQRLGGRIPRGVLLIGPPGCGKTLLAKAIAGEADVPFLSISGSDFVEMFVGVGASRVRDLFKQAKDNSPCIIFLDEVDAIGRKRGAGYVGGGHDEREQTLNAILVEMDGFDTNDQVILIAATNRGDILDHALTRPGRFDRQVVVPLPDLKGRLEILKVHARKVKLGEGVELERLARGTPMFSGADLAAIINESALLATMANKDYIELTDLEEARDKVRWGRAKKSRVTDEQDRKLTAYHEAGHAFIQASLKDADPLHKVSIIPRGPFGGATFALPEKDRIHYTKRYCRAFMQVCFGGRIAEEIFCDDISSGAQADIQQATAMARQMIVTWGMSVKMGPISYEPDNGMGKIYYPMPTERDYSDKTAEDIDSEVRTFMDEAYASAKDLIESSKDKVENIARALLKYETLDAHDVKLILEGGQIDKPTVADLIAAEQAKDKNSDEQKAGGNVEKDEPAE